MVEGRVGLSVGCAAELQIGSPRLMWRAVAFSDIIDMQTAAVAAGSVALPSRSSVNTIMEMCNEFLWRRLFELDNKVVQ